MNDFNSIENDIFEPRKSILPLFFLIDISNRMQGKNIDKVNIFMREILSLLSDLNHSLDFEIKIFFLLFSKQVYYMFDQPKPPEDITWFDIKANTDNVDFKNLYFELNRILCRKKAFKGLSHYYVPYILMISNNEIIDLKENFLLKRNRWFRQSTKIVITMSNDFNKDSILGFARNAESIFEIDSIDRHFLKVFKTISPSYIIDDNDNEVDFDEIKYQQIEHKIYFSPRYNLNQKLYLSYPLIATFEDEWAWDEDELLYAEVLSISPSRKYIICMNKYINTLFISQYSKEKKVFCVVIELFYEFVNIEKIVWDDEKSFIVSYKSQDEDRCIEDDKISLLNKCQRFNIKEQDNLFTIIHDYGDEKMTIVECSDDVRNKVLDTVDDLDWD